MLLLVVLGCCADGSGRGAGRKILELGCFLDLQPSIHPIVYIPKIFPPGST